MKNPLDTLYVGVDVTSAVEALTLFDTLAKAGVPQIKIGPVLMTRMGLSRIGDELFQRGIEWFMDAKFSNTDGILADTAEAACDEAPFKALNCMADSGPEAMKNFAQICRRYAVQSLAVSVLTTKDDSMVAAQHNGRSALEQVLFYANEWIAPAGMDGMVCSAQEASALRKSGYQGVLVCPGIRFAGSDTGDQRRVMTPAQAIEAGADYLVMSRDILTDPVERLKRYIDEVGEVL